jgi:hypothetical protein
MKVSQLETRRISKQILRVFLCAVTQFSGSFSQIKTPTYVTAATRCGGIKFYCLKEVQKWNHHSRKSIARSDAARATYYRNISGSDWGGARQYDLCIDSSVGAENTANIIAEYIKAKK